MAVTSFTVTGVLRDFGDDPRAGVEIVAVPTPSVKISSEAVHSNEPERVVTDATGAFSLSLISVVGVWYLIYSTCPGAMNPIRLAGYVPDVDDPTTGVELADGTVIPLSSIMDEQPTPGYTAIAYTGTGGGGLTWTTLPGKPSTFPPSAHTHPVDDLEVTGIPDGSKFLRDDGTWAAIAGGSPGFLWEYRANTGVTAANPGLGRAAWNNVAQASATALLVNHLTDADHDIDPFWSTLQVGETIVIQDADLHTNNQHWEVTGAPTLSATGGSNWWTIPVALISSSGTGTTGFANNHPLVILTTSPVSTDAVLSVNGETGAVVLDATDVGAAPTLGADDNYVTDAEKAKLAALSGTNTGDQTLPTWSTISGKPAVVAEGATQADARTAIAAATSAQGALADTAVQPTIINAKGDILAGTADDTLARVAVGSTGDSLLADSSATPGVAWGVPLAKINTDSNTAVTPAVADHGKLHRMTAATAITITLPQDSAVALPIGWWATYKRCAAGSMTFAAGTGATIEDYAGTLVARAEGSSVMVTKVAANTFTLDGDLAA